MKTPATLLVLVTLLLSGCATAPSRNPVPAAFSRTAEVKGFEDTRMMLDPFTTNWTDLDQSLAPAAERAALQTEPLTLLAISGGGAHGAWGAGILTGWTVRGDRPEFDLVTGISTGALAAPYAFLGPAYDGELKDAYTTISDDDIFRVRNVFGILKHNDSLADSSPLLEQLRARFDEKILAAIAEEHAEGRRLYVGTTNLDAQILTSWDMGAVAAKGTPEAHDLFCRILLASASVPAAFPPVTFHVEADGQPYDEIHADGGLITQVFGFGYIYRLMAASDRKDGRMFVLRNSNMAPEYIAIDPSLLSLAGRAIGTLTKTQGIGDVYRAWAVADYTGIEFNVSDIPLSVDPEKSEQQFDPVFMTALYEAGHSRILDGQIWRDEPPGLSMIEEASLPPEVQPGPDHP